MNYKTDEFIYLLDVMNSVCDQVLDNKPLCNIANSFPYNFHFSFNLSRMSWNIGENSNLFLRLKTNLGLYHVVLTTPKSSPTKITLTIAEFQQLPELEQCEDKTSCLKWTIYNGRRKICVGFQTDTDKVDIVVYRYRNNTYLKDTEFELKLTEYKTLLAKRLYLLSYWDTFCMRCINLDES